MDSIEIPEEFGKLYRMVCRHRLWILSEQYKDRFNSSLDCSGDHHAEEQPGEESEHCRENGHGLLDILAAVMHDQNSYPCPANGAQRCY